MCDREVFPLGQSHIKERQIDALRSHHILGGDAYLVVEMTMYGEIYRVPFASLDGFLAAPWRASLSIQWLRAHADLVMVSMSGKTRYAWVLDVKQHAERFTAYLAVTEEKARAAGHVVELFKPEVKFRRRAVAADRPSPGTEAYRERIRAAMEEGITRQLGARKWNPRRGRK